MNKLKFVTASAVSILALGISAQTVKAEPAINSVNGSSIPPQLLQYSQEGNNATAQNVTSVSQLSDVQPTDWAFTALQSLVERYGCIAGYPDRTFRGNRATTRYEFAAGLNACLDKINEILSSGLTDKVTKEDLAALQKLQEEFAAELALLKGRVDSIEVKTARLEAQQFSTTTKLEGQVIFGITGGGSGTANLFPPAVDPLALVLFQPGTANTTFVARARLDFVTSFTGGDLLTIRLEMGNGGSDIGSFINQPEQFAGFTGLGSSSSLAYSGVGTGVALGRLTYDLPVGKDIKVSIGPVLSLNDYLDTNSFANDESVDFSSNLFINNPLILPVNDGAGAVVSWNPGGGAFTLKAGYVAAAGNEATAADGINRGLGGDPYQGTIELEFAPKNGDEAGPFALRLQYTRASVNNLDYDIGGVNLEWAINPSIAVFGRYGFGSINNRGTLLSTTLPTLVNAASAATNLSPSTFSAGLAFPNLFKQGALAAIAVAQPFIESNVGNSTQTNVEAFYNFPISENISITPDLQFIFNPNNNSSNGTITVGTVRAVFNF